MFVAIGVLLILVGILTIWFNISYSPVKKQFQNDVAALLNENQLSVDNEVFTEKDFSHLPIAIQKYIENCGYIGTPKMSYLKMEYHNVDFSQGRNGSTLKIDYTQYNFVKEPCRMARIDSSMFGIPFEGYDYYRNGTGGMKGVIAKTITLFDQTGTDMNKACLVTFLDAVSFIGCLCQRLQYFTGREDIEHEAGYCDRLSRCRKEYICPGAKGAYRSPIILSGYDLAPEGPDECFPRGI